MIFFNEIKIEKDSNFVPPAWKLDNPYNRKCLFMPLALVFPFIHYVWISFTICFLSACSFVSFFIQQLVLWLFEFAFCFKVVFLEELLKLAHCGFVSDFLLLHHYYCHTGFGISWDPLGSLLSWYYLYVLSIYMRSVLLASLINIQHDSGVSECK